VINSDHAQSKFIHSDLSDEIDSPHCGESNKFKMNWVFGKLQTIEHEAGHAEYSIRGDEHIILTMNA